MFQLSNTDAGVNAMVDVVAELRDLLPDVPLVVMDMCDLHYNATDTNKLQQIFDCVIPVSAQTGLKSEKPVEEVRSNAARFYDRLLTSTRPLAAVVSNDRAFVEEEFVTHLRWHNIPVALLQESIRRDVAFPAFIDQGLAHGRGNCDLVLAWANQGREYFQKIGVPEQRIRVVGSPRMDRLLKTISAVDRDSVKNKLGISHKSRVVMLTTSPMSSMTDMSDDEFFGSIRVCLEQVALAVNSGHDVILLFRHHRGEKAKMKKFNIVNLANENPHVRYVNSLHLEDCLAITDRVINFSSTVAVEAGLAGIPVGILRLFPRNYGIDYIERGIARWLSTTNELYAFMTTSARMEPAPKDKLAYYVANVGTAAPYVAQEVCRIVKNAEAQDPDHRPDLAKPDGIRITEANEYKKGWRISLDGLTRHDADQWYKYATGQAIESLEHALDFIASYPVVKTAFSDAWMWVISLIRTEYYSVVLDFYRHCILLRLSLEEGGNGI